MKISKKQLEDRSILSNSVMWNQQLWGRSAAGTPYAEPDIPPAVEVQEDGSVICRFHAPEAESVSVGYILGEQVPMTKDEKGIWTGTLTFDFPGLKVITWKVNGVEVMNPYAPVGYGYGRPMNYVDIPCPEQDYLMIKDVPHGTVVRDWYRSETTGEWESCLVYLPPMYDEDPARRFPVLYLQHGGSQNENGWVYEAKTNFIADNLIAEGKAEPCIIVMNNGMVQMKQEDGSWKVNTDALEPLLINDCIPFIDKKYRTIPDAWNRAYAGLSMGSLQGAVICLKHMDVIASAGLFTGFPLKQYESGPKVKFDHTVTDVLKDPETFNRKSRLFYLAVGQNEPSVEIVKDTSEELTKMGINNVYMDFPGGHEWHVWRACLHDYLQRIFK
ncbi:MAG: hypothetical protein IJJ29_03775 [Solobacterium sp.]|nr:hypothetical protein [Solobacterium sp.]